MKQNWRKLQKHNKTNMEIAQGKVYRNEEINRCTNYSRITEELKKPGQNQCIAHTETRWLKRPTATITVMLVFFNHIKNMYCGCLL